MISLAGLLLLASSTQLELVDNVYRIPAGEWRYVELGLNQKPAHVRARYDVRSGPRDVRLALLRAEDVERLRRDEPHGVMAVTTPGKSGVLEYDVIQPGDYAIVVDNRAVSEEGGGPSMVRLAVSLDFAGGHAVETTRITPRRRLTVILVSFAVFFGIVSWSAHRLLRAMKR
jgi:hypothetical protein